MQDWQPNQYLKFEKERTQPTIDLINRIEHRGVKRIIDIGCGPGNSTMALKERWGNAELLGLDSSEAMVEEARQKHPAIEWVRRDVSENLCDLGQFDIVFSNAALQWMPNHKMLLKKLYDMLCPGGVLAVQVPYVRELPIYYETQNLIKKPKWEEYFTHPPEYPKHYDHPHYYGIISKLSRHVELWVTDYIHILPSCEALVEWYKGSGLRPILSLLPTDGLQADFIKEYQSLLEAHYVPEEQGEVLLPFKRVFFLVRKP